MAHIMVIDDDEQVRLMLRQMLERSGYVVTVAANGKEGLKLFDQGGIDLVITDIVMPEKEGIETIRELAVRAPELKILAMSGGGRIGPDAYLEVAAHVGASRTLTKPVERDELLACVREML